MTRRRVDTAGLIRRARDLVAAGKLDQARDLIAQTEGPVVVIEVNNTKPLVRP